MYEIWLAEEGIAPDRLGEIEARVGAEIDAAAEEALKSRDGGMPKPEDAERGVYA